MLREEPFYRYLTHFFATNLAIHIIIGFYLNNRVSALVNGLTLPLKFNLIENKLNLLLMNFLAIQRDLRLKCVVLLVFLLLRIYVRNLLGFLKLLPFDVSPLEILDFEFLLDSIVNT